MARRIVAEGADIDTERSVSELSYAELDSWLDSFIVQEVEQVSNEADEIEAAVEAGAVAADADAYAYLTGGTAKQERLSTWAEATSTDFIINDALYAIEQNLTLFDSDESDNEDKLRAYLRIYEYLGSLLDNSGSIGDTVANWRKSLEKQIKAIAGVVGDSENFTAPLSAKRSQAVLLVSGDLAISSSTTNAAKIKVHVLSKNESGLSISDENNQRIVGADVKLYDVNNPAKTVSGKTNDMGIFTFNAKTFQQDEFGYFIVSGTVAAAGKRTIRIDKLRVKSGEPMFNRKMIADNNVPYIEGVSLRENDVILGKDVLYITPKNDIDHNLVVSINPKGTSGSVVVSYVEGGNTGTLSQSYTAGTTSVNFKRPWCQSLTPYSSISVQVVPNGGSAADSRLLNVSVLAAIVQEPSTMQLSLDGCEELFGEDGINIKAVFNDNPVFKGLEANFRVKKPAGFKPGYKIYPDGRYAISLNYNRISDYTKTWKKDSESMRKSLSMWWKKKGSLLQEMLKNGTLKRAAGSNWGTLQGGGIDASVVAMISGKLSYKTDTNQLENNAEMNITLDASAFYNYVRYFIAWFIPLYAGVEGGVNFSLGLFYKSKSETELNSLIMPLVNMFKGMKFDKFVVSIMPYIRLFAGAGIRGLIGARLEGMAGYKLEFTRMKKGRSLYGYIKGGISIIGEFFFVRKVKQLLKLDDKSWAKRKFFDTIEKVKSAVTSNLSEAVSESDNSMVPSDILEVEAERVQAGDHLTNTLAAASLNGKSLYLYNDEENRPCLIMTYADGTIYRDEMRLGLAEKSDELKGFDETKSYIYSANLLTYYVKTEFFIERSFFIVEALMANYDENVIISYKNEDGSVSKVEQPGRTYVCSFVYAPKGKGLELVSESNPIPYEGMLTDMNSTIAAQSAGGSGYEDKIFIATTAFDSNRSIVAMHTHQWNVEQVSSYTLQCWHDMEKFETLNVNDIAKANGLTCKSVVQSDASTFNYPNFSSYFYETYSKTCLSYISFKDQKDQYHLLLWAPLLNNENKTCLLKDTAFEALVSTTNTLRCYPYERKATGSYKESVFITVKQPDGRYQLTRCFAILDERTHAMSFVKAEDYNVYVPYPNISTEYAFGMNIFYWLAIGSSYIDNKLVTRHQVDCVYLKENNGEYLLTQPLTMMTFNSNQFPTATTSMSNLMMLSAGVRRDGIVRETVKNADGKYEDYLVKFEYPQVIDCTVTGAHVNTPLVAPGQNVEVLVNIKNTGNQPLSATRLSIYDINNENNNVKIKIDFTNPAASYSTFQIDGEEYRLDGNTAAVEYDSSSTTDNDMLIVSGADNSKTAYHYNMMLPGQTKTYRVSFKMPETWGTGLKTLVCRCVSYWVNARLDASTGMYVAANSFADGATCYDFENGTITELTVNDADCVSVCFDAVNQVRKDGTEYAPVQGTPVDATGKPVVIEDIEIELEDETIRISPLSGFVATSPNDVEKMLEIVDLPAAKLLLEAEDYFEDGERMVELTMSNPTFDGVRDIQLSAYADGSELPCSTFELNEDYVLEQGYNLTVTIPEAQLTNGQYVDSLELVLTGKTQDGRSVTGSDECALNLSERIYITRQPASVIIDTYGTEAVYQVEAAGGGLLSYQWQFSADHGKTWTNIAGANTSTLRFGTKQDSAGDELFPHTSDKTCNGWKFRCVVTGSNGMTVITSAAKLNFAGVPTTDDAMPLTQTIAACMLCLLIIALLLRRRRTAC